jgi:hypothetical protein
MRAEAQLERLLEQADPAGFARLGESSASSGATAARSCGVTAGGRCVQCGACRACERRIRAAPPARLVSVSPALLVDPARPLQLDARALLAFQRLYRDARAAGVPSPYLKIVSGYRPYARQARLWQGKILSVLRAMGCDSATLNCLLPAVTATSQALQSLPVPHPKDTWERQFLRELARRNCVLPCDPRQAIRIARQGVAPPGGSPHHTGRAVDLFVGRAPGASSSASTAPRHVGWQHRQPSYRWLVCNAARYGFYPYNVEPWHWEFNPPT